MFKQIQDFRGFARGSLWSDYEFAEDKARARGLTNMSSEVADLLKELTTAGKRLGGLHAASGTLRGELGDNVRLSLLNILFKSVGLPPKYPVARFVMWLRENGKLDAVPSPFRTNWLKPRWETEAEKLEAME